MSSAGMGGAIYICSTHAASRSSRQTARCTLIEMGITGNDIITNDSAENKSIGDYKAYGYLQEQPGKRPRQ